MKKIDIYIKMVPKKRSMGSRFQFEHGRMILATHLSPYQPRQSGFIVIWMAKKNMRNRWIKVSSASPNRPC